MPRRTRGPKAGPVRPLSRSTPVVKRLASYRARLKVLRQFSSEFDAKRFDKVLESKPRTSAGRAARKTALAKVARTYKRLAPYVARPHKVVAPKNRANFEELRKYTGFMKLKGAKAIPVMSEQPKLLRVTFDKKNRVTIRVGKHYKEKFFRFPHVPFDVDDAVAMTEKMLPEMPDGIYVIATRHHFLIPTSARKKFLPEKIRALYMMYGAQNPEFVKLVFGFKWLASSTEVADRRLAALQSERARAKQTRKEHKARAAVVALKAMQAKLRGEPWRQKMSEEDAARLIRNAKRRAANTQRTRKTGRR